MAPSLLPTPIAVAHLSILNHGPSNYPEPHTWSKVPDDKWGDIRWDAIDALYLDPFMVQPDWKDFKDSLDGIGIPIPTEQQYSFGIDHPETRDANIPGTIDARINWAVDTARKKHPSIKIFAMQYYGTTALYNLVDARCSTHPQTYPGRLLCFRAAVVVGSTQSGLYFATNWPYLIHDTA